MTRRAVPHGLRRGLRLAAALLLMLVLVGATIQGVANALDRREYAHPGRLVPIGDHQLHIVCTGEGRPIVVLEAPAAGMSSIWEHVRAAVAAETRVCAYDRAGLGWSEAGPAPFAAANVPHELRTLLANADERPPFVVAGAGLGAAFARLYAFTHPAEVAALVVADAATPPAHSDGFRRLMTAAPWLARTGVLRVTGLLSGLAAGLPAQQNGELRAFLHRPDHLTRAADELAGWPPAVDAALAAEPPVEERRVTGAAGDPPGFLTTEADAAPMAAAILQAVADVRAGRAP